MSLAKFYISKDERSQLPLKVFGHPTKRLFPILSEDDVMSAAKLLGRAKLSESEKAMVKKRVIAIAKREGYTLPEAWQEDDEQDLLLSVNSTVVWNTQNNSTNFGIVRKVEDGNLVVELCTTSEEGLIPTELTFSCKPDTVELYNEER